MELYLLIVGDPIDGFAFAVFDSTEEAETYIQDSGIGDVWWVRTLKPDANGAYHEA
jgi:hypothetical protein